MNAAATRGIRLVLRRRAIFVVSGQKGQACYNIFQIDVDLHKGGYRRHPSIVRARLRRQVGDIVAPLRSSEDRIGHVLVCGPVGVGV